MKYILTAEKTSLSAFATTFQPMNKQGIKISAACESSPLICKNKPLPNSSSFNNRNITCIQYTSIFILILISPNLCLKLFHRHFDRIPAMPRIGIRYVLHQSPQRLSCCSGNPGSTASSAGAVGGRRPDTCNKNEAHRL